MPTMTRLLLLGAALLAFLLLTRPSTDASAPAPSDPGLRRPVALQLVDDGKVLLVANRDSGTVSVLDTQRVEVTAEVRVGRRLSDLAASRNGDLIAVTEEDAGEVILLA